MESPEAEKYGVVTSSKKQGGLVEDQPLKRATLCSSNRLSNGESRFNALSSRLVGAGNFEPPRTRLKQVEVLCQREEV